MDIIVYEIFELSYIYFSGGSILNHLLKRSIKSNVADDTITDTAQYFEDIYGDDDSADVIEIRKI